MIQSLGALSEATALRVRWHRSERIDCGRVVALTPHCPQGMVTKPMLSLSIPEQTASSIQHRCPHRNAVGDQLRDPNDDMVIACALTVEANYIVTRDRDLLDLRRYRDIVILSPRACAINESAVLSEPHVSHS